VLIDHTYQQLVNTLNEFGVALPPTADPDTARRVFDSKERQVSDLFKGSISGRSVFNVEVPVIEGDAVPFVLIMSFQASHIADLLNAAGLERPWISGVTDNKGIIVARSERHDEFVGKPLPSELLAQSRSAAGVFRATSVAGEQVLRATARSRIAGWLVSATLPASFAEAPSKRGRVFAFAMIATALVLGAALAFVFASFMTRPLAAATSAAQALGQGHVVHPLHSPLAEANFLTETLSAASSELKRRQEHADFLMRELAHRAKNQLAVVRGMAAQTAKQSTSVDQFVTQLGERIQALAQSQDLLLRQNWQGAWLGDLVSAHLDMFGAGQRVDSGGPAIFLNGNAVQNIGFALHELATNASKHGALSAADGRVVVRWSGPDADSRILIRWSEHDGPTVRSSLRQGFGHLVLTQLVARSLQGEAKLDFASHGVCWQLDIPASHALSTPIARTEMLS
jgi:two-component sensor histidine kinase